MRVPPARTTGRLRHLRRRDFVESATTGRSAAEWSQPWPRSLSLLVELPAGECLQAHVTRYPFLIGRLDECDLTLRDTRISRRHARIRLADGNHYIDDLMSRHGITVNGKRVSTSPLSVGDRIAFGIEDSFAVTVCDVSGPDGGLLKEVSGFSGDPRSSSPLGRLAAALDVARTMEASEGVDVVFDAVVAAALSIARADRAFLLLRNEAGELEVKVASDAGGRERSADDLKVPTSLIADALDRRRELFSMSIPEPLAGGGGSDGVAGNLDQRTAVCVPILRMRVPQENETSVISAKKDTLGVLYMERSMPDVGMAESSQVMLQALAIEISTVLENARLIEEERKKRGIEHELRMARRIQRALLPRTLPSEGWLVAKGHCEPSSQVGGDYFDLMQVAPDRWVAVVADVSGKDVAASILASLLQGAFFLGSGPELSLSGTLRRLNHYLCGRFEESRFVTLFALVISEDGTLRWSNAGHCAALLVRESGAVERLVPTSRPVGLFDDAEFAEDTCRLGCGDRLVIYSDGVSERRNPSGELYGETRLAEAASSAASLPTAELFDELLSGIRGYAAGTPQADDLTLLVLGYRSRRT